MRRQHVPGLGLAAVSGAALLMPPAALSQGRGPGFRPCPYTP
jgi:hypothetical protein